MTMTPLNFGIPPLAVGSIYTGSGTGTPTELPIGANGYILKSNGTNPLWSIFSASDITTGILADARLSTNIPLLNTSNSFSVYQLIDSGSGALPTSVNASTLAIRFSRINDTNPIGLEGNTFTGASAGGGFAIYGVTASGTRSSPSATLANSPFWSFGAFGHNGSAYTGQTSIFRCLADGDYSGSNYGTFIQLLGTSNGSTSRIEIARWQNGAQSLGGATVTPGNGLLQFATGTTKANGVRFGGTNLYRSAAGYLVIDSDEGGDPILWTKHSSGPICIFGADSGAGILGTTTGHELALRTSNFLRIRIGPSGYLHFAGGAPIAAPALPAAATDAATTQALANSIRTALISYGLCT